MENIDKIIFSARALKNEIQEKKLVLFLGLFVDVVNHERKKANNLD
jgi:hypothetical protein